MRSRSRSEKKKPKTTAPPVNNVQVPGGRQIGVRGEWAEFLFPDGSKLFRNIISGEILTGIPTVIGSGGRYTISPPTGLGQAPGQSAASKPATASQTTLFILHVPAIWTELDLAQHFSPFGTLLRADLPKNMDGSRKGYGFVTYASMTEGQKAIDGMHGFPVQDINGTKTLGVSFRAAPPPTNASMGMGVPPTQAITAADATMNQIPIHLQPGKMVIGGVPGHLNPNIMPPMPAGSAPLPSDPQSMANLTLTRL